MGGLRLPVALLTIPLRSAIRPAVILGSLVGVIPLIVMFLGLQKYWRAGLAAGAVKG